MFLIADEVLAVKEALALELLKVADVIAPGNQIHLFLFFNLKLI